jgi:hypothetical protein
MSQFWKVFIQEEGRRLFFLLMATAFGIGFLVFAGASGEMKGTGVTVLTGCAMYCFNRMRGTKNEKGDTK